MKINDFEAKRQDEKKRLEKKLDSLKIEKVLSLWYFVVSSKGAVIVGSKR